MPSPSPKYLLRDKQKESSLSHTLGSIPYSDLTCILPFSLSRQLKISKSKQTSLITRDEKEMLCDLVLNECFSSEKLGLRMA